MSIRLSLEMNVTANSNKMFIFKCCIEIVGSLSDLRIAGLRTIDVIKKNYY